MLKMKTSKLIFKLRNMFPKKNGYDHDFSGLQIGYFKKETNNIVVCLDFDFNVLTKIKNIKKIDLIITHHPFIYGEKEKVLSDDYVKNKLANKIEKLGIPIYSIHTNFDCSLNGMNETIAEKLGLNNIHILNNDKIIRGGFLPYKMNIKQFAQYVKNKLKLPYVFVINEGKKYIKKVALCAGAGADLFIKAKNQNYDIFCSGDAPHHIRHNIYCYHYNYLEIPHEVEKVFIFKMKKILKKIDSQLNLICIDNQKFPKLIL